jgi:hypothetical protein
MMKIRSRKVDRVTARKNAADSCGVRDMEGPEGGWGKATNEKHLF